MEFKEKVLHSYRQKLVYLRMSEATMKVYCPEFERFVNHFGERIDTCTKAEIETYIVDLNLKSPSHQNTVINAIKFYLEKVVGRERATYYNIDRPKKEFRLPDILTPQEVLSLTSATDNLKHRAMLQFMYSCALRNAELRPVTITQIAGKAGTFKVVRGKGKRDRIIPIPEDTLLLLRQYYTGHLKDKYNPHGLLFMGEKQQPYSQRSLQLVVQQACARVSIKKHVTPHTFRHSRATHWHNNSMSTVAIKRLLGHRDLKTTEIYLHTGIEDLTKMVTTADNFIKQKMFPTTDKNKLILNIYQQITRLISESNAELLTSK